MPAEHRPPPNPRAVDMLLRLLRQHLGDRAEPREPWAAADYPTVGSHLLFIDGWSSRGGDSFDGHFLSLHRAATTLLDPTWAPSSYGFSYVHSAPRTGYIGLDTFNTMEAHIDRLVDAILLPEDAAARWIVIAYSLGAAVALIAMERAIARDARLAERVPLLILVEPAIDGAPAIVDFYRREAERDTSIFPREQPMILLELGRPESAYATMARSALPRILNSGVAIDVLYAEADTFAPLTQAATRGCSTILSGWTK